MAEAVKPMVTLVADQKLAWTAEMDQVQLGIFNKFSLTENRSVPSSANRTYIWNHKNCRDLTVNLECHAESIFFLERKGK